MRFSSYVGLNSFVVLTIVAVQLLTPAEAHINEEKSVEWVTIPQPVHAESKKESTSDIIETDIKLPEVNTETLLSEVVMTAQVKSVVSDTKTGRYEGEMLHLEATAYTPYCEGCTGVTKTGLNVRKNFHSVIAVDPTVIPLYSVVEVYYNGELYGVYEALDTGGVIKGNIIDILHKTKFEANRWGRKQVQLKIVSLPQGES